MSLPFRSHSLALPSVSIALGFLCFLGHPAMAQEDGGDLRVVVGAGAIYAPDYEGSDDFEVQPFLYLDISYRNLAYVRGSEIAVTPLNFDLGSDIAISAGALARYRRDRSEDDNPDLAGLGDVDFAIEAGGLLRVDIGPAFVVGTFAKDVVDAHDGMVATVEAGVQGTIAPRLGGSFSARTSWVDENYMDTYFAVSPEQARLSGLAVFSPAEGIKDVGADAALGYELFDRVQFVVTGGYTRLLNDAADSPIVSRRGSKDQWQVGAFLAYRF